jgi:hypothetical protein
LTTLQIREEQYLGSLTCHILKDTSKTIFDNFIARSDGIAFSGSPGTYDPYSFGKKQQRFYNCDIFLGDKPNFQELAVDLEVVLILQPLLRRNGKNVCDVPLITKQNVRIEFEGYKKSTTSAPRPTNNFMTGMTTILRKTSFKFENEKPFTRYGRRADFGID